MVDVKESVRSGESIAKPLSRASVFPPMVTHMISIGEETGALDAMLNKVADFYEDEVDSTIKSLTSIIEPIMMLVVGAMVGVIIISMYLPMFNMMNLVK
jgi:type IV pilus assembly protein PilC